MESQEKLRFSQKIACAGLYSPCLFNVTRTYMHNWSQILYVIHC